LRLDPNALVEAWVQQAVGMMAALLHDKKPEPPTALLPGKLIKGTTT